MTDRFSANEQFIAHLEELEQEGAITSYEQAVTRFEVHLDRDRDCEVWVTEEDEEHKFEFEISCGPQNARALIAFLRALPPEPDD